MADTTFVDGDISQANRIVAAWLNAINNGYYRANSGISGVTSAMYRTALAKFGDIVSVKDFGVTMDGVTDDTTAMQAAIDAVDGTTVALYMPPGICLIPNGGLTCSGALRLYGAGRYASSIQWTSTTANVLTMTSTNQCALESFTFTGPASASAGAAVVLTAGASAENTFSIFRDLAFTQGYSHISMTKAAQVAIENCYFNEYVGLAVTVQNTNDVDSGDSHITGCIFSTTQTSAEAIRQLSSGGLRVTNNKILGGAFGYRMILASAAATSICLIEDNSFELQTTASINAVSSGGGATFTQFVVNGNQFSQVPIAVKLDHTSAFMSRVEVNNNLISLNASATYGILLAYIDKFIVDGNTINGGGATPTGIAVASTSSNGKIGVNHFDALTINVENASTTCLNAPPVALKASGSAVSVSASTSEEALATITIPAKQIGNYGVVRVRAMFTVTNGADDKIIRIRYSAIGGTAVFEYTATTVGKVILDFVMQAVAATNSQKSNAMVLTDAPGVVAPATVTSAIDTTAVTTMIITGQKETSGNTLTLDNYTAELIQSWA